MRAALATVERDWACCAAADVEVEDEDQTVCEVAAAEVLAFGMADECALKAARKLERNGRFEDIVEGCAWCGYVPFVVVSFSVVMPAFSS